MERCRENSSRVSRMESHMAGASGMWQQQAEGQVSLERKTRTLDEEGCVLPAKRRKPSVPSGPGHVPVHLLLRCGQVGCGKGLLACPVAEQSLEKSGAVLGATPRLGTQRLRG